MIRYRSFYICDKVHILRYTHYNLSENRRLIGGIYTHITNDMQRAAAANIDRGIESSTTGGRFKAGVGNCPGPGGKAENDRLQALRGP